LVSSADLEQKISELDSMFKTQSLSNLKNNTNEKINSINQNRVCLAGALTAS